MGCVTRLSASISCLSTISQDDCILARLQPRPASASDLAGLPLPSLRLFKLKKRYRNVLDTMFELLPRMAR